MQPTENEIKKADQTLTGIRQLVKGDFDAVDRLILTELASEVPLINEITQHIIQSGGKRLRPLVLLLMANVLDNRLQTDEHHELAAIIEFIHTATLLHDDVVDDSSRRRNQPTANALWGNAASVLAGDFLYSRAFQILARRNNIPVMRVLADTTNLISEGEMLQLINRGNSHFTEQGYFKVIRCKTAELYSAAAKIGAMVATNNNLDYCEIAAQYGLHLGMAFQMIDDLLDYTADAQLVGKNLGDDLAEGKVTLPLIYALHQGNQEQQDILRLAIQSQGREAIDRVVSVILASKGCEYTFAAAEQEIQQAKNYLYQLPNNAYRQALLDIGDFVVSRGY